MCYRASVEVTLFIKAAGGVLISLSQHVIKGAFLGLPVGIKRPPAIFLSYPFFVVLPYPCFERTHARGGWLLVLNAWVHGGDSVLWYFSTVIYLVRVDIYSLSVERKTLPSVLNFY